MNREGLEGGVVGGDRGDGSRGSLSIGEGQAVGLVCGRVFVVDDEGSRRCVLGFGFAYLGCLSVAYLSDLTEGHP